MIETSTELRFTQFNLLPEIQQALAKMGFETPSPIQAESLPILLEGKDIIGQAQTGSGKTAAFAIPSLHNVKPEWKVPQVLVLAPTRELAMQIADVYRELLAFLPQIKVVSIYGGQGMDRQMLALQKKPQIIVATPGRLLDHVRRGSIRLFHASTVILDEADEMLKMGFREDIETILSMTAQGPEKTRQTILFSATMPRPILQLAQTHQNNPVRVEIEAPKARHENIQQEFMSVAQPNKPQALKELVDTRDFESLLVFCNTKIEVDSVVKMLCMNGKLAEGLHGGKPQYQRERILNRFKRGGTRILVATEVAARGIDVANIEAVLNYDFPEAADRYTHRIGRTGRAGKDGIAISFVTSADQYLANLIQNGKGDSHDPKRGGFGKSFGKNRNQSRRGPGFRSERAGGASRSGGPNAGKPWARKPGPKTESRDKEYRDGEQPTREGFKERSSSTKAVRFSNSDNRNAEAASTRSNSGTSNRGPFSPRPAKPGKKSAFGSKPFSHAKSGSKPSPRALAKP